MKTAHTKLCCLLGVLVSLAIAPRSFALTEAEMGHQLAQARTGGPTHVAEVAAGLVSGASPNSQAAVATFVTRTAVRENQTSASVIVGAIVKASPGMASTVVTAAIDADPGQTAEIVTAAAAASPGQAQAIVGAAIRASPASFAQIAFAAAEGAPGQSREILAEVEAFVPSLATSIQSQLAALGSGNVSASMVQTILNASIQAAQQTAAGAIANFKATGTVTQTPPFQDSNPSSPGYVAPAQTLIVLPHGAGAVVNYQPPQ